ncbi:unnamed protein product [Oppiella nova]|uniref:Ubiquitin-like domain-containing protein n=1 Tax=Oppiella nova TaxID=334625 RepID=A0A7R9MH23_9ACAR|nr:unnamed protein product [Oppiella nova]CAG2177126.1 unnamed protein product [Oppiella nova]
MNPMVPQVIHPHLSADHQWIGYSFGTRFRVRQLSPDSRSHSRVIPLSHGFFDNIFIAHFATPETHFEVDVDNTPNTTTNIEYCLRAALSPVMKTYHLRRGSQISHKAITTGGQRLVFVGNTGAPEIARAVQWRADRYGVPVADAWVYQSRLCVNVFTEKPVELIGDTIRVIIKYVYRLNAGPQLVQRFDVRIGSRNTVAALKKLIDEAEGIPFRDQMLLRKHTAYLKDSQVLSDCDVGDQSEVYLIPKVFGGRPLTDEVVAEMCGNRGVLCFGDNTDQVMAPEIPLFKVDPMVDIKSFIIELRSKD